MRQLVLGAIVATIALFSGAAAAAADEIINIPIDTVITRPGTSEGDVRVLARAPVAPDLVGATCTVESEADNQSSVHPNNDVIVSSGSDQVVIPGVEDEPGQISLASGTLTLGTEITAAVRIGPDRQFSGGIIVQLDCDTPEAGQEPTTTVAPTTVPPTEPEVTVQDTVPGEPTTTVAETTTPPEQTTASTTPTTTPSSEPPQQTTASTTPPDDGEPQELPRTGGSTTTTLTIVALVLLGGGGALVLVTRRSPQHTSWVD